MTLHNMEVSGFVWSEEIIDKLAWKHQVHVAEVVELFANKPRFERLPRGHHRGEDFYGMGKNKTDLPETFDSIEEMADFWDTHDLTDYAEFLTPVEATVANHPTHDYVISLSDSLNTLLHQTVQQEGVSLNTLVNLWVQEKLQQYTASSQ